MKRQTTVLLSGLVVLGATTLHAKLSYRRNAVTHATNFADRSVLTPVKTLSTTGRLWELDKVVGSDEISPDMLVDASRELLTDLLNQSTHRGVGLDWNSFRLHIFDSGDITSKVIARVDVL